MARRPLDELRTHIDEGLDVCSEQADFVFGRVSCVCVVARLTGLERARQCPSDVRGHGSSLDEVPLKQRNGSAVAGRIEVSGREDGTCRIERGIDSTVGSTYLSTGAPPRGRPPRRATRAPAASDCVQSPVAVTLQRHAVAPDRLDERSPAPDRIGQEAFRHHARRDVDIVLEVDIERDVHDGAFEARPIVVGRVHHDQDVDVRIRTGISTSDRPEQTHIGKQRTEGGAELPCKLADGPLPAVLE